MIAIPSQELTDLDRCRSPAKDGAMTKSQHGRVPVFVDNCVWDLLFEQHLDLAKELPADQFCLFIVREVEFEIEAIAQKKPDLALWVRETIGRARIRTRRDFGFHDERHSEEDQRVGGFGDRRDGSVGGFWVEADEAGFEAELLKRYPQGEKRPKTRLYRNEADIALAVRSLHSVVLTLDQKAGPLRDALGRGGKVVYLKDFNPDTSSLASLVMATWTGREA